MKNYKLYLFDFDGTLIDSDPMIEACFIELYNKYKPDEKIDKRKLLSFSGPPIKETLLHEFPSANQKIILDEFLRLSKKYYDLVVKPYPGAKEVLLTLKNKGIKTALITSKAKEATLYALKTTGLDGLFDCIITASDVKKSKPNPEGALFAMKSLGISDKNQVIMIGDSNYDYLTAKNAKIDFGYVTYSPRKLTDKAKVDIFINSFHDFIKEIENAKD